MTLIAFMMMTQPPVNMQGKAAVPTAEIAGIYTMKGEEKGTKYYGVVYIDKVEKAYHITSVCGPSVNKGWAIRNGDFLSWAWSRPDNTMQGVTLFKINGRSLVGQWTRNGDVWTERLDWVAPVPED